MKKSGLGVVIGRFQAHYLHKGHLGLLAHALERHPEVLVLLGSPAMEGTRRNPLPYEARSVMLLSALRPENRRRVSVERLSDHPSDKAWSERVDAIINSYTDGKPHEAVIYGSRDSFAPRYHGRVKVRIVKAVRGVPSATEIRQGLLKAPIWQDTMFRAGVVYAAERLWPQLYMCVDVAVYDPARGALLLGRKHAGDGWCFPGGFVDPTDDSLEMAASRELLEETGYGVSVGGADGLRYIGSALVDDWRYKGPDRIMTSLFLGIREYGSAGHGDTRGKDDLAEIGWVLVGTFAERKEARASIKPHHRPLFDMLIPHLPATREIIF